MIIETERLILRMFKNSDYDDLFEYLEFTESESLFDMMCKMIYTNAPEI